ncbi:MAG: transposase, partial [Actinobacteria bacterium]|nr:transposase [Actinomycetota bacterium]
YWAADALAELGATVHLAHPLGVKMFSYRRVKNDERDAADLADLLRMGRLPEAWIAPPATRELRELVRHRAKLVALRSNLKCQVHAVLAACGVPVAMSDLFGAGGQQLLQRVVVAPAFRARVNSPPPGDRSPGLRDRVIHQPGGLSAARPRWLYRDPDHFWGGTDPGRGVRRRDR